MQRENSFRQRTEEIKALKAQLEDPNLVPRRDLTRSLLVLSKSVSGSLKGSFRLRQPALNPDIIALLQIRWKLNGSTEYKEDILNGSIELLQSKHDPAEFYLSIHGAGPNGTVHNIALPPGIDWNVTSEVHHWHNTSSEQVEAQVIQLAYYDSERQGKVKLRIGLPLKSDQDRKQAHRFGESVKKANILSSNHEQVDLRLESTRGVAKQPRSDFELTRAGSGSSSRLIHMRKALPSKAS